MKDKIEAIKALIEVQKQVIGVDKDAKNPFFKSDYITYDNLIKATRQALSQNGFAVSHESEKTESNILHLKTLLIHVSGQFFESTMSVTHDGKCQSLGSAMSYLKRYTLQGLLAIASGEDSDGNEHKPAPTKKQSKQQEQAEFESSIVANNKKEKLGKLHPAIKAALPVYFKNNGMTFNTSTAYEFCQDLGFENAKLVQELGIKPEDIK